jgi:hypothetical protein
MVDGEELRFRNYQVLQPDGTFSPEELYIFDLHLRALVIKAMAIIAISFGCHNPRELAGLLLNFNEARNLAAHHSRLWNRNFHYAIPEKRLVSINPGQGLVKQCNSFAACFLSIESVLKGFPALIDFRTEFEDLVSRSPLDTKFLLSGMGFEVP